MFCPQCGKEIGEKQKVCAECAKNTVEEESTQSPDFWDVKHVPGWRWAILGIVIGAGLCLWFYSERIRPEVDRQDAEFVRQMAILQVEKPQWNEISRTLIVSQSFDLHGYFGWLHDPLNPTSGGLKVFLIPHCAASDPDRVMFVIMDEQNAERMRTGYPPIVLASSPIAGTKEVELPYGRRYWFGFVELASKPDAPGSIPTSALGAAIYLLNQYQKQSHPPIRLTAEIYSSVRLYATPTEARREVLALRQKLAQPSDSLPPVPPSQSSNPQETPVENELRAIGSVRAIFTAVTTYCNTYQQLPGSLADLASVNLINSDLASGETLGYRFVLGAHDCNAHWVVARPLIWNSTGTLSFYLDERSALHITREDRTAVSVDPILGNTGQ